MVTIEVAFDTYKELTVRRPTESTSYDEVIRGLLKLPSSPKIPEAAPKKAWIHKGVTFLDGTELRANYKGKMHSAQIVDGVWIQDGTHYGSPSEAAHAVTGNNVNGWTFWECRLPGETKWRVIKSLR